MKRWLRWGIGVVAVAAVGTILTVNRAKTASPVGPPPIVREAVVITAEPVTPRPLRRIVEVVGSLYGWEEVPISPRVEGRIVAIRKDVGDRARPGEVLLEIDPTDYQLALDEQQRGLELELAKLGLTALPGPKFTTDTLPAIVKALAQEKNAAARNDRLTALRRTGGVSGEEADVVSTEYAIARANLQQARFDAASILASARLRQAAVETAKQKLKDTIVTVPNVAGPNGSAAEFTVCARYVSAGESVRLVAASSTTAYKLVITNMLKMVVSVPERHISDVSVGQSAELEMEAYPGRTFTGTVARVNPSVDRATRMFQVEVHIPNTDGKLRPGSFAKARIVSNAAEQANTVPEEAIVTFAGVVKVFVVTGETVHAVPITTGASVPVNDGGRRRVWMEVVGELPAGARVATSGLAKLAEGTPVQVREPLPTTPEAKR